MIAERVLIFSFLDAEYAQTVLPVSSREVCIQLLDKSGDPDNVCANTSTGEVIKLDK